ncbi:hypothetical protein [Bradyrhizobium sp. BR 10261]|uniref:hypothetical protein n=1 Tax=Bradyrhizobium sp. BR 10261 TaxID=2749992 RepID=UPI001C6473AB|nr:hypothetical protein [Bradyrhizobium sp. BR 10261]MBW7966793.1 hypothetical protein [Bradyrhizobium sp. BR 10261]
MMSVMQKHRLGVFVLLLGCAAWAPSQTAACGYHDDVSLARGALNWIYPDALHVIGAISTAVADRRLPAGASVRRGPDLFGYHATVRSIERLGRQLHEIAGEMPGPEFSLLLIEPMLWTRFVPDQGDLQARVHVSAPQAGELVIISGEEVIRAIANNALTIGEAYRSGLMRLYGADQQVKSFLARYDEVGARVPRNDPG